MIRPKVAVLKIVDKRALLWKQYLGVPKYWAAKLHKSTGVDYRDLVEVGESALAELLSGSLEKYDPEKSKLHTWIMLHVKWAMLSELKKRRIYWVKLQPNWLPYDSSTTDDEWQAETFASSGHEQLYPDQRINEIAAEPCWVQSLWSELGQEGRMLLRVVFEAPGALAEELWSARERAGISRIRVRNGGSTTKRRALRRYLKSQGWDAQQVERGWSQIVEALC
jgi:hypothetical protein